MKAWATMDLEEALGELNRQCLAETLRIYRYILPAVLEQYGMSAVEQRRMIESWARDARKVFATNPVRPPDPYLALEHFEQMRGLLMPQVRAQIAAALGSRDVNRTSVRPAEKNMNDGVANLGGERTNVRSWWQRLWSWLRETFRNS